MSSAVIDPIDKIINFLNEPIIFNLLIPEWKVRRKTLIVFCIIAGFLPNKNDPFRPRGGIILSVGIYLIVEVINFLRKKI